MTESCKKCYTVVDLDNAPFRESGHSAMGKVPAFDQRDWTCPKCGGLLAREIDGVRVESGKADPRKTAQEPALVVPVVKKASKRVGAVVADAFKRAKGE